MLYVEDLPEWTRKLTIASRDGRLNVYEVLQDTLLYMGDAQVLQMIEARGQKEIVDGNEEMKDNISTV